MASSPKKPGITLESGVAYAEDVPAGIEAEDQVARNLIVNGSFETKDEMGRPNGWIVAPPKILAQEGGKQPDAFEGKESVTLRSTDASWGILGIPAPIMPGDLGKTLHVTAVAKTAVPNFLFLTVQCNVNGKFQELARAAWPVSNGKWQELSVSAVLPAGADPASVQARISTRNAAGHMVRVDDVRVAFGTPAAAVAKE